MTLEQTPNDAQDAEAPAPSTREGLLAVNATDLLSEGLTPTDPAPTGDADGEEDAPPAAAPAARTPQVGEATPKAQAVPASDARYAGWVAMLAENPNRVSEVPAGVREKVVEEATALRDRLTRQIHGDMLRTVEGMQTREATEAERVATFVELAEAGDHDALAELEESDPEGAQLYHSRLAKAAQARAPRPEPSFKDEMVSEAGKLISGLTPEQQEQMRANNAAGKYPITVAGLMALRSDVDALAGATRTARPAAQRSAAATARAALPRVDASAGEPPEGGKTKATEMLKQSGTALLTEAFAER